MKYDFSSPEYWKALEKQAYNGTVDISCFPPAEYRYFDKLTKLYHAYRFEGVSREEAQRQKKQLLNEYRQAQKVVLDYGNAVRDWNNAIRLTEMNRTAITKSDSIEEKLRFAIEAIGAMTGDRVFEKYELKRLGEVQHGEN